jgi:hypothetical protein
MAYKPKILDTTEGGTGLSSPGSNGNVLTSNGTIWTSAAPAAGGIDTVTGQIFTASGAFTYTPTSGMTYVIVELVGGGGGSGGASSSAAGSSSTSGAGAAGNYARFILTAAQVGAGLSRSVGVGGTAGTAGNNNGGAGGDTTLATAAAWTVKGGGGGTGAASASQATARTISGGTSSASTTGTGIILADVQGQNGGPSFTASSVVTPGIGGDSVLGLGGIVIIQVNGAGSGSAGTVGTGYGAGAGGAGELAASTNRAGAAGTNGVAIFTEFTT